MQRLQKIGHVTPKNAAQVRSSRLGIGFEKLDRDVFDPEKAYDKVAALGVKWVRIQSGWQRTEREKGVYSFAWLDSIVDQLIVRGLRPWICLCYGNGLYDENAAKIFGAVGVPPIFTQEQRAAWRGYVAALVERYRDRVSHYEIWNEPDWCWKHGADATELGNFTVDTARVIRSVYPGARIIGGVLCDPSLDFINRALATTDMARWIDAISFHEYTADERSVPERVRSLHACADRYRPGIGIIQGESGSQSRAGGNGALHELLWTEKAQMKQLARHTLMDLATDVEFTSYFSCMDMIEALHGKVGDTASYLDYGYFGVLSAEFDDQGRSTGAYHPKPSYFALQAISAVFAGEYQRIARMPLRVTPQFFAAYGQQELGREQLALSWYRREGGEALVYWKPENVLTTDFLGTLSGQLMTEHADFTLIDLCDGTVYALPEGMVESRGYGLYNLHHLPVRDTPLALVMGKFCDWSEETP